MNEENQNLYAYEHALFDVENNVQDRSSLAWEKLCEYVDMVAEEEREKFAPVEYLGKELYAQIHTLPESISTLKKVKQISLYGSALKRVPPAIGEMTALEYFEPYTSYQLHWFPYKISNCKNLKDSLVSTRALYGNNKHRRPFPDLRNNPVRYDHPNLTCSICKKELTYDTTRQVWISLEVGSDVLPLLVNLCSQTCEDQLPLPPETYIQQAHQGGKDLKQPLDKYELWKIEQAKRANPSKGGIYTGQPSKLSSKSEKKDSFRKRLKNLPGLKLIRKLWGT